MYIDEHNPKECADVVFQNTDLANPSYISRANVIHNQKYMYSLLLIVIILV